MEDQTKVEPFTITKRAEDTNGEFMQVELTLHPSPSPDAPQPATDLQHRRWIADSDIEHLHPQQEESFTVLSGELRVAIHETTHTLSENDEVTIPPTAPHRHWNPTNHPTRVVVERRPALQSDSLLETSYVLAQTDKTNETGLPNLLQLAVLQNAHLEDTYTTTPPILVQKAVVTLLAPIGRLAGYKPYHSIEELEKLR